MCENSKGLEFLGFGFPLFYTFLKNCIILLLSLICTYAAFAVKSAYTYNWDFCHNAYRRVLAGGTEISCDTFMVWTSSKQDSVTEIEEVMRIVSFCFHFGLLVYMRDHMIKLEAYYDERNTSLSDYSVIIKEIPKIKGIQNKIKNFFLK